MFKPLLISAFLLTGAHTALADTATTYDFTGFNELDIAVVDQLSDHGYAGPEASSPALEDDGLAKRTGAVTGSGV